jgi:uncharacterized damage-inducible protein DinB
MPTPADAITAPALTLAGAVFSGTVKAYFPYWDSYFRPYLLDAVDLLPAEHFDFKPRPDMLTARQVILHIAEVERMWVHHVWEKQPYEDFVVAADVGWKTVYDAPDHNAMKFVLEEYHRHTQRLFGLPASELEKKTTRTRRDGATEEYTLHWILAHTEEHEIHHRAQLNLYLRMLGITPPSV